ncbi:hypothetical protein [Corynebacterium variabile]|uniref:hypothetical protein n=1 Tax=Corynebacterium variabile TaxID=1727 RepID=UPI0028B23894|nr:hypothetical protein [Corynebacterium variabile]
MTDLNSSRPSALRRWATRGAVAVAGLGTIAGAMAPAASAAPAAGSNKATMCSWQNDVRVGPVHGGRTQGDCRVYPGRELWSTNGGRNIISLGQVILPGGINYSAWVDKVW